MIVESLKARSLIIVFFTTLAGLCLLPNFIEIKKESPLPFKNKLVYGLDIQGGLHLVMSADVESLVEERLSRQAVEIQDLLKEQGIEKLSYQVKNSRK